VLGTGRRRRWYEDVTLKTILETLQARPLFAKNVGAARI
jgi:hypothetical protein